MADTTPSPGFFDALGDRVVVVDKTAGSLEVLRLRPELSSDPAFEAALRSRAEKLAALQHPGLARVRHVGRLPSPDNRLAVVSDLAPGVRLSEVLQASDQIQAPLHTNAALFLLRQILEAAACLHGAGAEISHGAIAPERLVVSPTGRLTLVEHVLGGALPHVPRQLVQRSWKDLRVALAAGEEPPFGRRSDLVQVGMCGLALVLSRPLRLDEYPARLSDLFDNATESRLTGERRPLRQPLRAWLERAIGGGDAAPDAWTIQEARSALDELVSSEGYLAAPTGLVSLMQAVQRYIAGADPAPPRAPAPSPAPPAPRRSGPAATAARPSGAAPAASRPSGSAPVPASSPGAPPVAMHPAEPVSSPAQAAAHAAMRDQPAAPPSPAVAVPGPPTTVEARPTPALRLVTFPSGAPAAAPHVPPAPLAAASLEARPALEAPQARVEIRPTRTQGALAVAASLSAPESQPADESFAPEPGLSFPPDEPEPAPPPAPPSKPERAAAEPSRAASPARTATGAAPPPPMPAEPRPSGATPTVAPAPASGPLVEPIAAAIERDRLADLVHTRPGRREGSGAHRAASSPSGHARAARPMFGADADEPGEVENGRGLPLPLMLGGGLAVLAALLVLAWIIFGSGRDEGKARATAASAPRTGSSSPAGEGRAGADGPAGGSSQAGGAPAAAAPALATSATPLPASLAGAAAEAQEAGSLRLALPFVAEVFEDGVKLGTTDTPIVLGAGRHVLELVNADLAFTARQPVDVLPGRATSVAPKVPPGRANINATPWAEVWIDGARAGETPLGNLELSIGQHQVVFRHPELGEQSRTLVVTAAAPARLSVEMRR